MGTIKISVTPLFDGGILLNIVSKPIVKYSNAGEIWNNESPENKKNLKEIFEKKKLSFCLTIFTFRSIKILFTVYFLETNNECYIVIIEEVLITFWQV